MNVNNISGTIELDADDIRHLMSTGETVVSDTDSETSISVKCRESLTFQVVTPDGEVPE